MAFVKVASVSLTPNGTSADINTLGANLIAAFIADDSAASTLSDNQGNTFLLAEGTSGTPRTEGRWLYCINPNTSLTHNFTSGNGDFPNIDIIAFVCTGTPQLDATSKATAASANNLQGGPVTPSAAPALILSGAGFDSGIAAIVASDPGFTVDYSNGGAGGVAWGGAAAYYLGWASGAVDPEWSTGAGAMNVVVNVSFIEVTGGGTNVEPDPVVVEARVVAPSIAMDVTPTPVVVEARVVAPGTKLNVAPSPVVVQARVVAPTVSLRLSPTPVAAHLQVIAPAVALRRSPAPVEVEARVVAPTVTVGGAIVVTPEPIVLIARVVAPTVTLVGGGVDFVGDTPRYLQAGQQYGVEPQWLRELRRRRRPPRVDAPRENPDDPDVAQARLARLWEEQERADEEWILGL